MTASETDMPHANEAARRERSHRTLADNARWFDEHRGQTAHARASTSQLELFSRCRSGSGGCDPLAWRTRFFVASEALRQIQSDLQADDVSVLRAFDGNRALIYHAAARVYARGRRSADTLVAAGF